MPLEFVRRKPTGDGRRRRGVEIRRQRSWNPDPSLYDDLGRRSPSRHAPAPPKRTQFDDTKRGHQEFTYIKKIGEGGQGRCDLFQRASDGKLFVYKLMKGKIALDERKQPKESTILMKILGPHRRIIDLYYWSWTPSSTVFYMEYCPAGDLQQLIKNYHNNHRKNIPESFIWHVYLHLAEALAFIHTGYNRTSRDGRPPPNFQPIVHRDIKPHNVFLRKPRYADEYPDIVLADFGLATRSLRSCERKRDLCGTVAYQGPEVPLHSRAGDCWAIGACVHAMAVGNPPIKKTPRGVHKDDWMERPEARKVVKLTTKGYSWELDEALFKVLRTRPEDRYRGKELLDIIEDLEDRWGGDEELLAKWALPC